MEVDITSKVKDYVRYGLIGLVVLVLLAGGGVYLYQHHNRSMTVYGAQVAGTLVPAKARSAGKITEIVVSDGDHVNAGDVIARVETNITDEEIQQLQQNLDLSKQSLEQLKKGTTMTVPAAAAVPQVDSGAQQRAAQAYSRLQRMNELFSMGAISAVKRDEAAAAYAAAKAAASSQPAYSAPAQTTTVPVDPEIIKQAEAQVKQAEAALANAKQDQQSTEILAPAAGTVLIVDGMANDAEVKANQVIVNIMDAGDAWVEAHVTSEQAKNIRLGQFAEYEVDGHKLQGSVKDVADASDAADDNADQSNASDGDGRLTVRISIPSDLSFTLKPGMEATIKFVLGM
ncbi:membrane fusion protein, multidrug efflux system [Selenomonas sp. GACV-9]|uniref:HlyD family secretion protein n=1 Tax=Selenomonas sp. GACV-9 TaxID=3158782 RepID=UPI0008E1D1CD|nr:membrane fusion protein, multidrug efflux system [Selenomonas ruminantium]